MKVDHENALCTVIVTVDGAPDAIRTATRHASEGLAHFAAFDGFVAGATHVSTDGRRIVQYLQWENEAAHAACISDSIWDELESSRLFMGMIGRDELSIDVRIYQVNASTSCEKNRD